MQRGIGKLKDKVTSSQGKFVETQGPIIQGSFGVAGISALIKGATYVNEGEVVCPWSPELIDLLLVYGTINVALPVFYMVMLCVAYYLRQGSGASILSYLNYVPLVSTVINFGLIIWGFVLLYSNSDSVTYDQYGSNSTIPNKNYCNQSVYLFSMIIVYAFVSVSIITTLVYVVRYIRARRN